MFRFSLIFAIIVVMCVGFSGLASAQCISTITTTGTQNPTAYYDACNSYVHNSFTGQVQNSGGYEVLSPYLHAGGDYYRDIPAGSYDYGWNTVTWWNEDPIYSTKDNRIWIDYYVGGIRDKVWNGLNCSYTVTYYAQQQQ